MALNLGHLGVGPGRGGGGQLPLIFRTNWGPKGRKKIFWRPAPHLPLSKGLDDRFPPPLSRALGPALSHSAFKMV